MNNENRYRREGTEQSNSGTAATAYKHIWNLKFRVLYSLKWHSGLHRWWKFWEEAAAIFPILMSLSVVGTLIDKVSHNFSLTLAAVSAILSLFSIAKNFGGRAFFYESQRKRYSAIFDKLERPDLCDANIKILWDEFNDVEKSDWEEGLEAYGISCYNKTAIQLGVLDACKPLPWYRLLTMCIF